MLMLAVITATATLAVAQLDIHTQQIIVGPDGGLGFGPAPNTTVGTGDGVEFVFDSPGALHTVTQVSFDHPCAMIQGGFSSPPNYAATSNGTAGVMIIEITDDTQPIWFACLYHCDLGEVGVINPPDPSSDQNFDAFFLAAMNDSTVDPWLNIPAATPEDSGVNGALLAFINFTADATAPSDASNPGTGDIPSGESNPGPTDESDSSSSPSKISAGAVAGVAVGAACLVAMTVLLGVLWCNRRERARTRGAWAARLDMSLRRAKNREELGSPEGTKAKFEQGV